MDSNETIRRASAKTACSADFGYLRRAARAAVMSVGGVEEAADAVVSAALGRAQERQAAQLLAAGAHGGRGGKVIQETVAQLGELDGEGRATRWSSWLRIPSNRSS